MKILVLGGYGLIGAAVVARLLEDGHSLVGLGRDVSRARLRMPSIEWVEADMARLLDASAWLPVLGGVDVVVNAAGALQDGARDDLEAIHHRAIAALVGACETAGVRRFVQISAVGAEAASPDRFFSTKAEGDRAVAGSALAWTILRPGLVISPIAYGGTALLRALASFPVVVPAVLADRMVQTVSVDDVADAISRAVPGEFDRQTLDLVEAKAQSLAEVLLAFRRWLGFPDARVVPMPAVLGLISSSAADMLGRLGWRSPLRSAALAALERGVTGDPGPWQAAGGAPLRSLDATLGALPVSPQERWFARLWLLKPVILACLSLFWIASGVIGLARLGQAAEVLTGRGIGEGLARAAVVAGAAADIVVGVAVTVRSTAKPALWGMIVVSLAYLAGSTVLTPDLWLDPLGPLVKIFPSLCLVLVALCILDER